MLSAFTASLIAPILAHSVFTHVSKQCYDRIIWKVGGIAASIIGLSILPYMYLVLIVCLILWFISITCNSRLPGLMGCWIFLIVITILLIVSLTYIICAVKSNNKHGGGPGACGWPDVMWSNFSFLCQVASLHFLCIINTYIRRMVGPFIFRQKLDKVLVNRETLAKESSSESEDERIFCPPEAPEEPPTSSSLIDRVFRRDNYQDKPEWRVEARV
ncbi:hypothetical protein O0L34_g6613 [Tuta absoluta]|nr:hypothetical protein O0L34_g6613 [Tuta absoluta]